MSSTLSIDGTAPALDEVLTRVAGSSAQTRHLHQILGGYCHEARNLLNCLKLSLYLARRLETAVDDPRWDDVQTSYQLVERFVDRIQGVCRPASLSLARLPLGLLFEDRAAAWSSLLEPTGRRLRLEPPDEPALGQFDPVRLGLGFDDLVAWRSRSGDARTDLRVRWSAAPDGFRVSWDEPRHRRTARVEPGDDRSCPLPCDVLTLPLLTRIVTLHGGRLEVARSGPWRIELRWPLNAPKLLGETP